MTFLISQGIDFKPQNFIDSRLQHRSQYWAQSGWITFSLLASMRRLKLTARETSFRKFTTRERKSQQLVFHLPWETKKLIETRPPWLWETKKSAETPNTFLTPARKKIHFEVKQKGNLISDAIVFPSATLLCSLWVKSVRNICFRGATLGDTKSLYRKYSWSPALWKKKLSPLVALMLCAANGVKEIYLMTIILK